jgi:hypothetical protein
MLLGGNRLAMPVSINVSMPIRWEVAQRGPGGCGLGKLGRDELPWWLVRSSQQLWSQWRSGRYLWCFHRVLFIAIPQC